MTWRLDVSRSPACCLWVALSASRLGVLKTSVQAGLYCSASKVMDSMARATFELKVNICAALGYMVAVQG